MQQQTETDPKVLAQGLLTFRREQAQKCQEEIQKILAEYGCELQAQVVINGTQVQSGVVIRYVGKNEVANGS